MATLIDDAAAEWTNNEVIELQATDLIEGAATGASYGGIGRSNQQAQQLANRTAYLKQKVDLLLAWMALFTTDAGSGFATYVRTQGLPARGSSQSFYITLGLMAGSSLGTVIAQWVSGPGLLLPGESITFTLDKSFTATSDYLVLPSNGCIVVSQASPTTFTIKNPTQISVPNSVLCLGI